MFKITPFAKIVGVLTASGAIVLMTITSNATSDELSGYNLTDYNAFYTNGNTVLSDSSLEAYSSPTLKAAVFDDENNTAVEAEEKKQAEEEAKASQECVDDPNGLTKIQEDAIKNEQVLNTTGVNLDKIYDVSKSSGCFDVLNDFPDLSINIPGFDAIYKAMLNTLIKYAQHKVCAVVNEAIEQAVGPINDKIGEMTDNGKIDLNGVVNDRVNDQINQIDPQIADIHTKPKNET